jgi:hypothetical protein
MADHDANRPERAAVVQLRQRTDGEARAYLQGRLVALRLERARTQQHLHELDREIEANELAETIRDQGTM